MLGFNTKLDRVGKDLYSSRMALDAATVRARDAAIKANADGVPETVIAKKIGVSRTTVRQWLGK
jgi:DNA-directed RNA polymerase specialized sigma24 family protein